MDPDRGDDRLASFDDLVDFVPGIVPGLQPTLDPAEELVVPTNRPRFLYRPVLAIGVEVRRDVRSGFTALSEPLNAAYSDRTIPAFAEQDRPVEGCDARRKGGGHCGGLRLGHAKGSLA